MSEYLSKKSLIWVLVLSLYVGLIPMAIIIPILLTNGVNDFLVLYIAACVIFAPFFGLQWLHRYSCEIHKTEWKTWS